jgi:hypothetical protein
MMWMVSFAASRGTTNEASGSSASRISTVPSYDPASW